ncbi:unnamed protein product, partial [Staurois parvus]
SVTKPTTVKSVCICSKAYLLYSLWNLRVNPPYCVKRLCDPVFSDPPLLMLSPIHLLIVQSRGGKLHMVSLVCIAREFFFSWEGACDQHSTNQHSADRGSG